MLQLVFEHQFQILRSCQEIGRDHNMVATQPACRKRNQSPVRQQKMQSPCTTPCMTRRQHAIEPHDTDSQLRAEIGKACEQKQDHCHARTWCKREHAFRQTTSKPQDRLKIFRRDGYATPKIL